MERTFWARVFFTEFIRHFRKMTDEEIITDIRRSMDDLEEMNDSGDSLGSNMVRWAQERIEEKREQRSNAGILSGISRAMRARKLPPPRSFDEVADFAVKFGLDVDDARLWWQRNFVERPGCDKDGVVFDNWKGALVNACRAEDKKRRNKDA